VLPSFPIHLTVYLQGNNVLFFDEDYVDVLRIIDKALELDLPYVTIPHNEVTYKINMRKFVYYICSAEELF
jgi:hypothetical protein